MTLDRKTMTAEQAIAEAKALFAKGNADAAEGLALNVLAKSPKDPQATQVFAAVAEKRGQTERAIRILRDSLTGASTDSLALMNLCRLLRMHGKLDEAREAGEAAVKLGTMPEALSDLADTYFALGDTALALETAERAVARRPDLVRARFGLAQALLRSGNYLPGWLEYDWRHQTQARFKQAQWNGMPLTSSRLLVLADASPTECLLFARYLPLIGERVKNVIVGCSADLKPLIAGIPGVAQVYDRWDSVPAFEFQTPITGLPLLFATTAANVPGAVPYLSVPPDRVAEWKKRLADVGKGRKVVGVSLRSADAVNAIASNDVTLVSAIKGADERVIDLSGEVKGLVELAAFVAALDAIVGEDSISVHLAGALGKPGVVSLPRGGDWVWLDRSETSPWYPTLSLQRSVSGLQPALKRALGQ